MMSNLWNNSLMLPEWSIPPWGGYPWLGLLEADVKGPVMVAAQPVFRADKRGWLSRPANLHARHQPPSQAAPPTP